MCSYAYGIDPLVWSAPMSILSLDMDLDGISREKGWSSGIGYCTGPGLFIANVYMHGQGCIHLWILKDSCLYHIQGSSQKFLRRLEHQLNSSTKALLLVLQQPCSTKKHCCMGIVATGMTEFIP